MCRREADQAARQIALGVGVHDENASRPGRLELLGELVGAGSPAEPDTTGQRNVGEADRGLADAVGIPPHAFNYSLLDPHLRPRSAFDRPSTGCASTGTRLLLATILGPARALR